MDTIVKQWDESLSFEQKSSGSVLVVEDDQSLRVVLTRILRQIDPNLSIRWVSSAEEAQTELKNNHRMVIADIALEGEMTGLDLWKFCEEKYPGTPVVMMSGMPIHQFLGEIKPGEITPPYLPKPFYLGEARQILEWILSIRK